MNQFIEKMMANIIRVGRTAQQIRSVSFVLRGDRFVRIVDNISISHNVMLYEIYAKSANTHGPIQIARVCVKIVGATLFCSRAYAFYIDWDFCVSFSEVSCGNMKEFSMEKANIYGKKASNCRLNSKVTITLRHCPN